MISFKQRESNPGIILYALDYIIDDLAEIKNLYKRKRDLMIQAIVKYFPKSVKWTSPKGGMFIWIILPKRIDTHLMLQKAIAKKVAYVSGDCFFPEGGEYNCLRLNFSYSSDENIKIGIKRLAEVIKEEMISNYKDKPILQEGV